MLRPLSPEHPDDETFEGLLILRPEGRLFFVNAQNVADQIQALVAKHKPRVVALDMSRVPDIEYSALQAHASKASGASAESGVEVWLAALNPGVLRWSGHPGLDARLWPRAPAVQRARGDRAPSGAKGRAITMMGVLKKAEPCPSATKAAADDLSGFPRAARVRALPWWFGLRPATSVRDSPSRKLTGANNCGKKGRSQRSQ